VGRPQRLGPLRLGLDPDRLIRGSVLAESAGRGLHEATNPRHRLRVEHDQNTLLIHLSDEDGDGWTTIAVDRPTRQWAVAQGARQSDTASTAYESLYPYGSPPHGS
jgi:hypothetical protein